MLHDNYPRSINADRPCLDTETRQVLTTAFGTMPLEELKTLIGCKVDVYDYGCSGNWTVCSGYPAKIVGFQIDLEEGDDGPYPVLVVTMEDADQVTRRAAWSSVNLTEEAAA